MSTTSEVILGKILFVDHFFLFELSTYSIYMSNLKNIFRRVKSE